MCRIHTVLEITLLARIRVKKTVTESKICFYFQQKKLSVILVLILGECTMYERKQARNTNTNVANNDKGNNRD
jgi:hypothetical protein